jgi:hypothetical protein
LNSALPGVIIHILPTTRLLSKHKLPPWQGFQVLQASLHDWCHPPFHPLPQTQPSPAEAHPQGGRLQIQLPQASGDGSENLDTPELLPPSSIPYPGKGHMSHQQLQGPGHRRERREQKDQGEDASSSSLNEVPGTDPFLYHPQFTHRETEAHWGEALLPKPFSGSGL